MKGINIQCCTNSFSVQPVKIQRFKIMTSRKRSVHVAEVYITSRVNLLLLFIGKERTKMSAPREAEKKKKKKEESMKIQNRLLLYSFIDNQNTQLKTGNICEYFYVLRPSYVWNLSRSNFVHIKQQQQQQQQTKNKNSNKQTQPANQPTNNNQFLDFF